MARAHEPSNGSDHPPQNGKGKQVAIALFIVTTFGIMAILSFPLSRSRLPIQLPRPLEAALSPIERLIRPIIPWLGGPSGSTFPKAPVALGPNRTSGATTTGPGELPGSEGPTSNPPPPPPGEGPGPPLTRTGPQQVRTLVATLVTQLRAILSDGTTRLSREETRLIQAELSAVRSMRASCLADPLCARQLKLLDKLLHRLEAHQRGHHRGGNRHPTHRRAAKASSSTPKERAHGRSRGHSRRNPERDGLAAGGASDDGQGKRHKKHGTSSHGRRKG